MSLTVINKGYSTAHVTKRRSGKDNWNYVICYRRNGYNVIACSNNLEETKRKFIEKLKEADAIKRAENCGYMVLPVMPYAGQQAVGATVQPPYIVKRKPPAKRVVRIKAEALQKNTPMI